MSRANLLLICGIIINMNPQKQIIIAGAGFGGLAAATELAKYLACDERWRILVIDKNNKHIYYPLLYEVASGRVTGVANDNCELMGSASIFYDRLFARANRDLTQFIQGEIIGVDRAKREVHLADGRVFFYEYLVGAFGSQTEYFDIEGLRQHAYDLKNTKEGLRIRLKIKELLEEVVAREKLDLNIVIGGGGPTGVELAGELANYFWKLTQQGKLTTGKYDITLVEGSPRLLSMCPPKVSARVLNRLENLGVRVLLDSCVKSVDQKYVTVVPRPLRQGETEDVLVCDFRGEKEKKLESDLVVWAGGIRAASLAAQLGSVADRKGRVEINEYCQVKDNGRQQAKVYAVGDCTLFQNEQKQFIPALAQSAIEEGKICGYNILADIYDLGKKNIKVRYYRTIVPVGGKYAVFVGKKYCFYGFFPWVIRELVNLKYFMEIMPTISAIGYWLRGIDTYSKND